MHLQDLLNIFELNGLPSDDHPYLFNGAAARSPLRASTPHAAAVQVTLWTAAHSRWR